ncbi:MAG: hypothetical protein ACI4XA_03280, partial [Oscillospiraceae bacterium]
CSPLSPKGSSSHFCENISKRNFIIKKKLTPQLLSNCPQKNFINLLQKGSRQRLKSRGVRGAKPPQNFAIKN